MRQPSLPLRRLLVAAFFVALAGPAAAALSLVMVEEAGCPWCARWNAEIGPGYDASAEGEQAPLRRVEIGDLPDDLTLVSTPRFTPTFILVEDGQELGRIEGYPGEHFFYPLLDRLIEDAGD